MKLKPEITPSTENHYTPLAQPDSLARRAALEKLAVLSAWTAPATLLLLRSKRASAESLPNPPPD